MATLTRERARAPLINDGNAHLRMVYVGGDYAAKTCSFELRVLPKDNTSRSYSVVMPADEAFRIAREIIETIQIGMTVTRKDRKP